jgi:integrase/recombinase XerD
VAKVSIYRNIQKKLKNNNNPIQLRITNGGERKYITLGMAGTGFNGNENTFDDNLGRFNNSEPNYKIKNAVIISKLAEAERTIQRFAVDDIKFSFSLFERDFVKKAKRNYVIHFFDEEIERLRTARRYGYIIPYTQTRNHIKSYYGNNELRFDQVNYSFLKGFESFLMARNVKKSTISVYMRTLRTVYNTAIKAGLCPEEDYPFFSRINQNGYSLASLKHQSQKRAIDIEQVRLIKDHLLLPKTKLFDYRNYWLFMYYCRGMNFSDIADLEWSDIIEGRLQYHRNKNNRAYNIKLIDEAIEILDYYKGKGSGNYVFPIHKTMENTEKRYKEAKLTLKEMNKQMNGLAKQLEIDANLTTYVARHTWATGLKNKGYPISIISEGLGHSSEKTTATYLKQFENSVLDDAGKDVF